MTTLHSTCTLESAVRSHIDLVYGSALRQLADPHLAADVTQAVFLILQQKFDDLGDPTLLAPWLLRVTRYACLDARKRDRRRGYHEKKAATMRHEVATPAEAQADSSFLDEALDALAESDRRALIAVHFENLSHAALAGRLGITEAAAHKRVQRATGRLRQLLLKKGLPGGALSSTLAAASSTLAAPAPAAVVHATASALAGEAPAFAHAIAKGTLLMMKVLQVKTAGTLAAALLGATVVGALALQTVWAQPAPPPSPAAAAPASPFGAEATLTINDDGVREHFVADLDAGKTVTPAPDIDRGPLGAVHWVAHNGIDLMYESSMTSLMGFDLAVVPLRTEFYEQPSVDAVMRNLSAATQSTPAIMNAKTLPAAYCFRTREGSVGVLQIVSVQEAPPRSATIRYRLLTPAARDAAAAAILLRGFPELQQLSARAATDATAARDLARTARALADASRGTPFADRFARLNTTAHLLADAVADNDTPKIKPAAEAISGILPPLQKELESTPQRSYP